VTKESKRERATSKDEKPRKNQTRKEERRESKENFMKHDLLRKKRALSNTRPRIKQPSK
jgi:hypothetical protein